MKTAGPQWGVKVQVRRPDGRGEDAMGVREAGFGFPDGMGPGARASGPWWASPAGGPRTRKALVMKASTGVVPGSLRLFRSPKSPVWEEVEP
jgi:hypothetical protein